MAIHDISLADLREDIAGAIPVDLVLGWNQGEKSAERHARLLAPYRARGTIVSTDAAGLSKLSEQYSLPQVMKLISEPKEVIFALGTVIGGEAIGVWAADNSQMFYDESIPPADVVAQMLAVQRRVKELTVQVGIGIHTGECYRVAGGLFGEDADHIEALAEDLTGGGEIMVTAAVYEQLHGPVHAAGRVRGDLAAHGVLWSLLDYDGPLEAREGTSTDYPTPFDRTFFDRLRRSSLEELDGTGFAEYSHEKIVAFVKIARNPGRFLLDTFTEARVVDLSIRRAAAAHRADLVKSNGVLAIVLFDTAAEAVSFGRDVIEATRRLGPRASVGVTRGEVFLFPLAGGGREIAGQPVNVASKLSEDSGLGGVLVDMSALPGGLAERGEPYRLTISGIELTGVCLQV